VADALRQEPGVEVELVDGNWGELTVTVDGQVVAQKRLLFKPSIAKVVKRVRETGAGKSQR
jgi:hypothetical protein